MRVAILSTHSSPLGRAGSKDTGGMSTYLRGFSAALGEKGHRVDLFTRSYDAGEDRVLQVAPNVGLICPADGLGFLEKEQLHPHCPAVADSIERFCRREKIRYDYIFSHYWLSGVIGNILQQRWDIPHLLMFHTLGRAKNESCPGENEPLLRLETEAELARSCQLLVAAAESEKKRLLKYYDLAPEKVVIIPGGIERSSFYPFEPKESQEAKIRVGGRANSKIILSVGRIEPVKGLDLTLKAAALLPAEDNFELFIVGEDDRSSALASALKEEAYRLGLDGKVRFVGVVDHDLLPYYYNAADMTVLASHYESFGLVALESIACGSPVVASPVGIVPELIGANSSLGSLIEERDPTRWAAVIHRVLTGAKPLPRAELDAVLAPFSWPAAAERFLAALSAL